MGERLAPPVVQFLGPRVDQPRRDSPLIVALFSDINALRATFPLQRRWPSPLQLTCEEVNGPLYGSGIRRKWHGEQIRHPDGRELA